MMFGVRKACRELAEWCHETQQENDRLKAENAKLREEIEAARHYLSIFSGRIVELSAGNAKMCDERERLFRANVEKNSEILRLLDDNAKLRAMVHALLQCHVEDMDTCAKCGYRSPLHGGCMADVKADELGVEQ